MTIQPALSGRREEVFGPMRCFRCGVVASTEMTVYQPRTIFGEKWPPLCRHCSTKVERMRNLSRRGDCE